MLIIGNAVAVDAHVHIVNKKNNNRTSKPFLTLILIPWNFELWTEWIQQFIQFAINLAQVVKVFEVCA